MQDIVLKAIAFAAKAHDGQKDKVGAPYILHCLRVLDSVKAQTDNVNSQCAAVLHDVIEDCGVTLPDLIAAGFSYETVQLVSHLSREAHQDYRKYLTQVADFSNDSVRIKLADLADNLEPARLARLPPEMRSLLTTKYTEAIEYLLT